MTSCNSSDIKSSLVRYARSLGFERVGIARAVSLPAQEHHLQEWLAQGCAGSMHYMEQNPARRARPDQLLPGAKSVIALAMRYDNPRVGDGVSEYRSNSRYPDTPLPRYPHTKEGRAARYARGKDYHRVIRKRLDALVRYLEALAPEARYKGLVDTGPLLERAFAQKAGLGFIGKNTMLITRGLGSWVFLASVITTLDLPPDRSDERSCGECRLCLAACPTQAITEPYHLDARLCIAYWTIEHGGSLPQDLRKKMGPWVFGCDVCQEVCPHNALDLAGAFEMGLRELLSIPTEDAFAQAFSGTAFMRAGRSGMIRNACVAAANLQRKDLLPQLQALCDDRELVVREHAAWAVEKLSTTSYPPTSSS